MSTESEGREFDPVAPDPITPAGEAGSATGDAGEPARPRSRRATWLAMGAVALALGLIWLAPGVGHFDESSSSAVEDSSGDPDDAKAAGKVAPMHFTLQDMN